MSGFLTPLRLEEYLVDGQSQDNQWVHLAPLSFLDSKGRTWTVPRGFIMDLASIPRPLKAVFNVNGKSRAPAALHDYLYCTQPVPRAEADALFLEAMVSRGVWLPERQAMWAGVRAGGWLYWNRREVDSLNADDFVPMGYFKDSDELQYCPTPSA